MLYELDDNEIWFPDPRNGVEGGLFAIGGDLSTDRLWLAYHHGIFPWYAFRENLDELLPCRKGKSQILWYCPMERFVIFPREIHVSHSMRNLFNKGVYQASVNKDFDSVIENCSKLRIEEASAWLGPDMVSAYKALNSLGGCLSIEIWDMDNQLVGGLYGVLTKHVFCGESMFSLKPNASKAALIYLSKILIDNNVSLIDCQFETPHLKSMGGRHISYDKNMKIMKGES